MSIASSAVNTATAAYAQCTYCQKKLNSDQIKKCSRCMSAIYCETECQKKDWSKHKIHCIPSQQVPNIDQKGLPTREEKNNDKRLDTFASLKVPAQLLLPSIGELAQEDNELIRMSFKNFASTIISKKKELPSHARHLATPVYNHPLKTKELILEGSRHLDPQKSVVVVCGAQHYEGKYVEPLPELLAKCKRMILLDVDQNTLNQLKDVLNSPKITIVQQDLSCASEPLESFRREVEQRQYHHDDFYRHAIRFVTLLIADIEARDPGIAGILKEGESAAYIVSSLVASQLPARINQYLFRVIKTCFKYEMEEFSGSPLINNLEALLVQLNRVMIRKHLSDLFACAGQDGAVYFADTFKLNQTLSVHPDVKNDIQKTFSQRAHVKTSNWHWLEDLQRIYTVGAYLCYPKG